MKTVSHMFIKSLYFKSDSGEEIGPVEFSEGINLLFGKNGAGKTRTFNCLYSFRVLNAVGLRQVQKKGYWEVAFVDEKNEYKYELDIVFSEDGHVVKQDRLVILSKGSEKILFDRNKGKIRENVKGGKLSDRLTGFHPDPNELSIHYAKDSKKHKTLIALREKLSRILRVDHALGELLSATRMEEASYLNASNFLNQLLTCEQKDPDLYEKFIAMLKSAYPQITGVKSKSGNFVVDNGFLKIATNRFPYFTERGIGEYIALEASSGYKKMMVLLFALLRSDVDIIMMDEVDVGLDYASLDTIIEFFNDFSDEKQIIATSHNPILVNMISLESWRIARREGRSTKYYLVDCQNKDVDRLKKEGFANFDLVVEDMIAVT